MHTQVLRRKKAVAHEKKVQVAGFGNGRCSSRGQSSCPTKQVIRDIASILPVLVLDEWGTSSRCPDCRSGKKLQRQTASSTNRPIAQPVLEDGESASNMISEQFTDDERCEHCSECGKTWGHDEVSLYNMSYLLRNLLKNQERPAWLSRRT